MRMFFETLCGGSDSVSAMVEDKDTPVGVPGYCVVSSIALWPVDTIATVSFQLAIETRPKTEIRVK